MHWAKGIEKQFQNLSPHFQPLGLGASMAMHFGLPCSRGSKGYERISLNPQELLLQSEPSCACIITGLGP